MTIKHEKQFGVNGPCWVARDDGGNWRTYAKEHFAKTPAEAVAMMYHANEVEAVEDRGEIAVATIAD